MTAVAFGARLDRLRERLDQPLLVTSLVNINYLTGFETSNAALLVDPDGPVQLFTDFRYIEGAGEVDGVEAVLAKRSLMLDLSTRLRGRVAFEADILPWSQVETLGSGGLDLVPVTGIVEALRAVKDEDEVGRIRRAALSAERAFEALTAETWIGRSERELAWRIRQLMHAHGVDHLGFETAVAAGLNGSKPHGEPTDAIVETRMLVTVDWGARLEGYCSDCTRTLSTGGLPAKLREIYDLCLEAQLAAVEGIRPGMSGIEADALARQVIEDAGYGENFGHGLGHGVGVFIHEAPRLSRESSDTIEVGNVITIEPGIYLPGTGGVRIEDLAVVREDGVELLTAFPKELVTVG
ncbi:MAG TPA: Xaa-Pro peptidase family protein [Gaiellaceae bacterium]|nr:Xaa-Pro peptidase family protein [Gaiellaceae bacterium]